MRATVLIVEDEPKLREFLRAHLERSGFAVLTSGTGADAIALARGGTPDLVVLDLRLPDIPGEEVARELRSVSQTPVLMLTAKSGEDDRIAGLEAGADDYLTKPFSPRELILRIQAILRRSAGGDRSEPRSSFGEGEVVVDVERRSVEVRGAIVELTPTEWGLLTALAQVPGRVYSRAELVNLARGYEFAGYERTIDSHVKNLRRKVERDPRHPAIVVTVLGGGYRFGLRRDG
jgi:DNA-binding response OmpR family regulator